MITREERGERKHQAQNLPGLYWALYPSNVCLSVCQLQIYKQHSLKDTSLILKVHFLQLQVETTLFCKSCCPCANRHFLSIISIRKGKRFVSKQGQPQPQAYSKAHNCKMVYNLIPRSLVDEAEVYSRLWDCHNVQFLP